VSDTSQGPGWWLASDGMWYPPETASPPPPPPAQRARDRTPHAPENRARRPLVRARHRHRRAPKPGETAPRVPPPEGKKPVVKRWWFWTAIVLVVVVVIVGTVWENKKAHSTSSDRLTTPGTSVSSTSVSTPHQSTVAAPSTTATSQSILPTAFFKCSGSAPGGVSITYGTNSSNRSGGSSLPWVSYLPVTSNSQSFDVSAQLQGSGGSIKCSTAVDVNGTIVTQTGTASGTHDIAKADVCSKSAGGWRRC
jgi:hypothetical protein